MRAPFMTACGARFALAGGILSLVIAAPSAQRGDDNAVLGVPVATNRILQNPDVYYGKLVTLSAGVEQILSPTVFVVDQRRAVGPKEAKGIGTPILVVAPYLTGSLDQQHYFLVHGEIAKLDPAAMARVAADYKLQLSPDVAAKYQGQPFLLATSVVSSTYVELARKPLAPPGREETSLIAVMKAIGPAFAALRTAAEESKLDVVTQNAAKLKPAFTETEAIWDGLGQSGAAQWAREARAHTASIDTAVAAGNWDAVKTSAGALGQLCQSCHDVYRERQPDGTFRIKPGTF